MIHWQERDVAGAERADKSALVSVNGPSGIEVGVGGVGIGVESSEVGGYPEGVVVIKFGSNIC